MKDELTGIDREKLISYEVIGGWPIYKKTLREILSALGAVESGNDFIGFDANDPILDVCPRKLQADVMGYGVKEEWLTEVNTDGSTYVNIFTEPELPKNILDTYVGEQIKMAQEIKERYGSRQLAVSEK